MVVEVGPSVAQNQEIIFDNEQYQFTDHTLWGGQVNLELAGVLISFEGLQMEDGWRMFVGLSLEKISYRGIF